jgi:predicted transcriptional regulator
MTVLIVVVMPSETFQAHILNHAQLNYDGGGDKPLIWFTSIVNVAKILSDANRDLLATLAKSKPASVHELSNITGKPKSTLARTLAGLARYGFVKFERGQGRALFPRVTYEEIHIHMPLVASPVQRFQGVSSEIQ